MGGVSEPGLAVMAAIEAGQACTRDEHGWRAGALAVPQAVVDELARHDLVRAVGARLLLTGAGQGFTRRRAHGEPAGRVLAERAVPDERPGGSGCSRARRTVTVNLAESPLGWLHARGHVSTRQFVAAERLRGDWTIAGLAPRTTMRWDPSPVARGPRGPGAPLDPALARIAAKRRFDAAIAAAGSGLSDILWRTVCAGEGIAAAEKALGWPRRAGKLILAMALDRIADHYGLPGG